MKCKALPPPLFLVFIPLYPVLFANFSFFIFIFIFIIFIRFFFKTYILGLFGYLTF